eukprot:SAG11_NODE_7470_length_1139_cov_1.010577_2_plen_106_part_01
MAGDSGVWDRGERLALFTIGDDLPLTPEPRCAGRALQTSVASVALEVDVHVALRGGDGVLLEHRVRRVAIKGAEDRRVGIAPIVDLDEVAAVFIARMADVIWALDV